MNRLELLANEIAAVTEIETIKWGFIALGAGILTRVIECGIDYYLHRNDQKISNLPLHQQIVYDSVLKHQQDNGLYH